MTDAWTEPCCFRLPLVNHLADPINVCCQFGVVQLCIQREVDFIGQQQVIEALLNVAQQAHVELRAFQAEVDVGAGFEVAFGA